MVGRITAGLSDLTWKIAPAGAFHGILAKPRSNLCNRSVLKGEVTNSRTELDGDGVNILWKGY